MMAECYLLQSVKCPLYNWTEVLGFFMFKYVDIFKKMLKRCLPNQAQRPCKTVELIS